MTKRQVLAAATLVALPAFVGVAQSAPPTVAATSDVTSARQIAEWPGGPQWAYALGLEGDESLAFAIIGAVECSFFSPAGSLACSIAGAL